MGSKYPFSLCWGKRTFHREKKNIFQTKHRSQDILGGFFSFCLSHTLITHVWLTFIFVLHCSCLLYYAIVMGLMGMDESYWDSGDYFSPIITSLQKEIRGVASKFLSLSTWGFFSVSMRRISASFWSEFNSQCHH